MQGHACYKTHFLILLLLYSSSFLFTGPCIVFINFYFSFCTVWHSYFPDFLDFLLSGWSSPMAIKQQIYLIFSHQFFIYFFNGINLCKTKYRWPRTTSVWLFHDLNNGLLATFWESQVLGSEDGCSGRCYIFCSLCF